MVQISNICINIGQINFKHDFNQTRVLRIYDAWRLDSHNNYSQLDLKLLRYPFIGRISNIYRKSIKLQCTMHKMFTK